MMRPQPAEWFEILVARDDAVAIAEALAAAGCAEFETHAVVSAGPPRAPGANLAERFRELERRFSPWWPQVPAPRPRALPSSLLPSALSRIETWVVAAEPLIRALLAAESELAALPLWRQLLEARALSDAQRLALVAGRLDASLFTCARAGELRPPQAMLLKPVPCGGEDYLFAIATPAGMQQFAEQVRALGGHRIEAPEWIGAPDAGARLRARVTHCEQVAADARQGLARLASEHGLAQALAEARRGCWCNDNAPAFDERSALCRVSGWSGDPIALRRTVDNAGVPALLRFCEPPAGLQAPLLLHNPWWARPYETFCRLLGMPERDAADPSAAVALIFPLLFGYMFGDLGQGLLLSVAGLLLGRRWPLARLFIPAGLSASLFGVIFGSVFSLHGIVPALWVEPLNDPLPVLMLPLFSGALLLLAGLLLSAFEASWRGQLGPWLSSDGNPLALYLGALIAIAVPAEGRLPVLAAALSVTVLLAFAPARGLAAGLATLAASVEKAVQLAINTISFVRVGAFAIAHAGLSAALALLAAAAGEGAAGLLVVVLGNVFIVALEVVVVSVQTTRLVLFEFFTRFFVGSGRPYQPAKPPSLNPPELRHEP